MSSSFGAAKASTSKFDSLSVRYQNGLQPPRPLPISLAMISTHANMPRILGKIWTGLPMRYSWRLLWRAEPFKHLQDRTGGNLWPRPKSTQIGYVYVVSEVEFEAVAFTHSHAIAISRLARAPSDRDNLSDETKSSVRPDPSAAR